MSIHPLESHIQAAYDRVIDAYDLYINETYDPKLLSHVTLIDLAADFEICDQFLELSKYPYINRFKRKILVELGI